MVAANGASRQRGADAADSASDVGVDGAGVVAKSNLVVPYDAV